MMITELTIRIDTLSLTAYIHTLITNKVRVKVLFIYQLVKGKIVVN